MNDRIPDENFLSQKAIEELQQLETNYGIHPALIQSLKTSKSEAVAHLGFFKRMMWVTNGGVIGFGLFLVVWSIASMFEKVSLLGVGALCIGFGIVWKFTTVLWSMRSSIRETERIARSHGLI